MPNLVTAGIYTTSEAARLLGVDTDAIRRWAIGYERRGKEYPPAVESALPKLEGRYALTFLELVELLSIRDMLEIGLSWPKVRMALSTLRRLLEVEHPFAMKRWFADPNGLFVEVSREDGSDVLVELAGDGQVFSLTMLRSHLRELEFGPDDIAERWNPLGQDGPIVVDPKVAFGQPTLRGTGIQTAVLYRMHEGGEDLETIAWAHDLDATRVEAAIKFERSLAA